jgi:hypothetical protein
MTTRLSKPGAFGAGVRLRPSLMTRRWTSSGSRRGEGRESDARPDQAQQGSRRSVVGLGDLEPVTHAENVRRAYV